MKLQQSIYTMLFAVYFLATLPAGAGEKERQQYDDTGILMDLGHGVVAGSAAMIGHAYGTSPDWEVEKAKREMEEANREADAAGMEYRKSLELGTRRMDPEDYKAKLRAAENNYEFADREVKKVDDRADRFNEAYQAYMKDGSNAKALEATGILPEEIKALKILRGNHGDVRPDTMISYLRRENPETLARMLVLSSRGRGDYEPWEHFHMANDKLKARPELAKWADEKMKHLNLNVAEAIDAMKKAKAAQDVAKVPSDFFGYDPVVAKRSAAFRELKRLQADDAAVMKASEHAALVERNANREKIARGLSKDKGELYLKAEEEYRKSFRPTLKGAVKVGAAAALADAVWQFGQVVQGFRQPMPEEMNSAVISGQASRKIAAPIEESSPQAPLADGPAGTTAQ